MYQIYINREENTIQVQKFTRVFNGVMTEKYRKIAEENPGEIVPYNNYYSFCTIRKNLIEYGRKVKQGWIDELKAQIEKVQAIQI